MCGESVATRLVCVVECDDATHRAVNVEILENTVKRAMHVERKLERNRCRAARVLAARRVEHMEG